MTKVQKIEKYIWEFFSIRYDDIYFFYQSVHRSRREGIYLLEMGTSLMDFLISIKSNMEERLNAPQLVPQYFATPERLIEYLKWFKGYLNSNQPLLDLNNRGEDTSYIIVELQNIKTELVELIDHVLSIDDREDDIIPYQELRHSLITKDLESFFKNMNSILASVSYAILKTKEGYLHSNIHLILKLLGFDIVSEDQTNIGRIDAVIRFSNIIYIFEFKLGTSEEALSQIKENKYYEKFIIEKKEILLVGVGFNSENRNIGDFKCETYK